jgi:hypothetical protein
MGKAFADTLRGDGGPEGTTTWSIVAGALPPGLSFEAASGRIAGIPEASGSFAFTARATIGAAAAEKAFTLLVTTPVLVATAVIDDLLGATALGADERRFLDLQGNRNGRVDIGDVRAWLMAAGEAANAAEVSAMIRKRAQDSTTGQPR